MSVFSLGRFANKPLIPNPFDSEDQARRFHHHDLADLTPGDLWSEKLMLEIALAARVAQRVRAQILVGWPQIIDDRQWLISRVKALSREQRRRSGRA